LLPYLDDEKTILERCFVYGDGFLAEGEPDAALEAAKRNLPNFKLAIFATVR
jgi:hypothetical protein